MDVYKRQGIDRISHVITAQKIVLYDFSYTPLDVIVIAFVDVYKRQTWLRGNPCNL